MTQQQSKTAPKPTETNPFKGFPPLLPMMVIAIVLVSAAQFPSTEGLAAAFAWLIFVAILMADGIDAFTNISNLVKGNTDTANQTNKTGIHGAGQPGQNK